MNLFYSARIEGKSAFLTDDEHRHCTKVLRYTLGDEIICTDGLGTKYQCHIHRINKKDTELLIDNKEVVPKNAFDLHMAIGMPKSSNRLDFLVEKLVEIGVQEITPLKTAHSERKKINIQRYRKKVISASTQSLKFHFPILHEMVTFDQFLKEQKPHDILVAHYDIENQQLSTQISNNQDYTILIGPEGDFSKRELMKIEECGIQKINLSEHRLRTETAAIVACTLLNDVFQKMSSK